MVKPIGYYPPPPPPPPLRQIREGVSVELRPASREPSQLDRIEAKLDALIAALAEDHDDAGDPLLDLDGIPVGGVRNQDEPL